MVRRTALALGLFLAPVVGWAAYNELPPGVVIQQNLGTGVFTALQAALNGAGGVVGVGALGTGVLTALQTAVGSAGSFIVNGGTGNLTFATGLPISTGVSGLGTSVAAALGNAVNGASGLLQLNASGFQPVVERVGVANNSVATAGNLGEVIASDIVVGSAVAVITATPKTITSVSLTAGDWSCYASVATAPAGTTTTSAFMGAISATTNVFPANEFAAISYQAPGAGIAISTSVPSVLENLAGTTTIFLVGQANFAVSTMGMYGQIRCRRMR